MTAERRDLVDEYGLLNSDLVFVQLVSKRIQLEIELELIRQGEPRE